MIEVVPDTPTTPLPPLLLTIDEVAQMFSTSPDTVRRWLRSRSDFPRPFPLPSRGIRWKAERVVEWFDAQDLAANAA